MEYDRNKIDTESLLPKEVLFAYKKAAEVTVFALTVTSVSSWFILGEDGKCFSLALFPVAVGSAFASMNFISKIKSIETKNGNKK